MMDAGTKVIVRANFAGVFAGVVEKISDDARIVILTDARRLWYWDGAASLSELAMKGVSKPENCKFPIPVKRIVLPEAIEILAMTDVAWVSVYEVPVWTAHK